MKKWFKYVALVISMMFVFTLGAVASSRYVNWGGTEDFEESLGIIDQLKLFGEGLFDENKNLKEVLSTTESEKDTTESALDEAEKKLELKKREYDKLLEDVNYTKDFFDKKFGLKYNENTTLEQNLNVALQHWNSILNNHELTVEQLSKAEEKIAELEKEKDKLNDVVTYLKENNVYVENKSVVDIIKDEHNKLVIKIENLTGELDESNQERDKTNEELEQAKKDMETLKDKLKKLEGEIVDVAKWSEKNKPYQKGAVVIHNNIMWKSKHNDNYTEPKDTHSGDWEKVKDPN